MNQVSRRQNITHLRSVFSQREREVKKRIRDQHKDHFDLLEKHGLILENLREAGVKKVAAGILTGTLVLNPISGISLAASHQGSTISTGQLQEIIGIKDYNQELAKQLQSVVPSGYEDLTSSSEQKVAAAIQSSLHIKATAELDGKRLNRSFGLIGAEQHLYRYPGDNIFDQLNTSSDFSMYGGAGIAPHVGAYGYFAPSKQAMSSEDAQREKWYVVAQTFLSPEFAADPQAAAQFFKYRKFIVINPDTGQAVVGDLADSGPGEHTGKSFGASPEVMNYLGYGSGPRKGRVIFFFVDDPQNQIPLGPVISPVGGVK